MRALRKGKWSEFKKINTNNNKGNNNQGDNFTLARGDNLTKY